jgi:hypothetical protein
MKKRYHLLLIVILTLFCVGSSYTTNEIPLRVGIFVGVDSITLSKNGSKFGLYNYRPPTESPVKVSRRQLLSLADRLLSKGFADDRQVDYPGGSGIPPQTYEIRIKWAKQEIVRRWYHADGYQVPEKYLQVLEELQEKIKQPVLKKFIEQNREIIASTAAEQALAADGAIACFGSSLIPSSGPGIARRR